MGINPFKESNLQNLQENFENFLFQYLWPVSKFIKKKSDSLLKIGKECITIMIVPHNEKRIINLNLPIYGIFSILVLLILTIMLTSIAISNYSSTMKDISKLNKYDIDLKAQIIKYKEEINKLYDKFQELKPELTLLYSLINDDFNSLWAKGGDISSFNNIEIESSAPSPSIEELNLKELEQELKITNEVLYEIKNSLKGKKIIENTPSISPVRGYILSKLAIKSSPYSYDNEYRMGIEIASYPGSKIRSPAPGRVESITWDKVLGLSITIQHKYGFSSIFSHCQDVIVELDQNVSKGETIAYVGKSGLAARHMCFYQIKIGTEFINAFPFIYQNH